MEVHQKFTDVTQKIGVKKAGQRLVGPGKMAWRVQGRASASIPQEICVARKSVVNLGGLTSTRPCEGATIGKLRWTLRKRPMCRGPGCKTRGQAESL